MDFIAIHAERQPDRPAVIEGERHLAWREFRDVRNRLAHALLGRGVRPGDHAAIYCYNSLEFLIAGAALRAAGAVPVPINHRLTADEVAYILDNSDATAVFVGDAFVATADQIRARASKVVAWISMGGERRAWSLPLAELVEAGRPDPVALPGGEVFGASTIYTAGTTGRPKGARRRASDPGELVQRLRALRVTEPDHVHLVAGPLYHSAPGGFALYAHLFGQTVVVMPRFDAEGALHAIERHRCTTTFMAPTLLKRIVDLPAPVRARHDVSSMRSIVMAAAPCPMRVKEQVLEYFGPVLYEFYGSTELGMNTVLGPEDVLRKPGSCGRAAPGVEIAILDDDGRSAPPWQPGELYVRRYPGVFDEYYKNPEATHQTQRGDLLTVGDIAYMDDEGFVYICDRKRDMIISGGVNIYPAEIEDALHRHPGVRDVAVFGVPDEEWGERVHAALELNPGETVTMEDIRVFCRQRLADYKIPREISVHDQLPRDSAGKLVKRVLRDPYWAGRAARI